MPTEPPEPSSVGPSGTPGGGERSEFERFMANGVWHANDDKAQSRFLAACFAEFGRSPEDRDLARLTAIALPFVVASFAEKETEEFQADCLESVKKAYGKDGTLMVEALACALKGELNVAALKFHAILCPGDAEAVEKANMSRVRYTMSEEEKRMEEEAMSQPPATSTYSGGRKRRLNQEQEVEEDAMEVEGEEKASEAKEGDRVTKRILAEEQRKQAAGSVDGKGQKGQGGKPVKTPGDSQQTMGTGGASRNGGQDAASTDRVGASADEAKADKDDRTVRPEKNGGEQPSPTTQEKVNIGEVNAKQRETARLAAKANEVGDIYYLANDAKGGVAMLNVRSHALCATLTVTSVSKDGIHCVDARGASGLLREGQWFFTEEADRPATARVAFHYTFMREGRGAIGLKSRLPIKTLIENRIHADAAVQFCRSIRGRIARQYGDAVEQPPPAQRSDNNSSPPRQGKTYAGAVRGPAPTAAPPPQKPGGEPAKTRDQRAEEWKHMAETLAARMDAMERDHGKKLEEMAREQDQKLAQILTLLSAAQQRPDSAAMSGTPKTFEK